MQCPGELGSWRGLSDAPPLAHGQPHGSQLTTPAWLCPVPLSIPHLPPHVGPRESLGSTYCIQFHPGICFMLSFSVPAPLCLGLRSLQGQRVGCGTEGSDIKPLTPRGHSGPGREGSHV